MNQNYKLETSKELPQLLNGSKEKFKLIITEELEQKIRHLCREFPKQEWSGVLFYNYKGEINKLEELELTAFDLYPLDLGTATYTEFTHSSKFAGYIARHPELMDSLQGLIHSHNSMPTFFSGTDTSTLREMAPIYKNYLSLIVNNEGTYTAAIGSFAKMETASKDRLSYSDLDYSDKVIEGTQKNTSKDVVLKLDCIIEKEGFKNIDSEFINNINELKTNVNNQSFKKSIPSEIIKSSYPYEKSEILVNTTRKIEKNLFSQEENVVNFICKLISQNYFYKPNYNISLQENIKQAMKTISKDEITLEKYSITVYDSFEFILNFMDITTSNESDSILKSLLGEFEALKTIDDYYMEIYEILLNYYEPEEKELIESNDCIYTY